MKKMSSSETLKLRIKYDDIRDWIILLKLRQYNYSWFALRVTFPESFPRKNPNMRFINPPYHVNVTKFGRIYPEFNISHSRSFEDIIKAIQELLNTQYFQLRSVDVFDKFEPADREHARTFSNQNVYNRKVNESIANGKPSPDGFY